MRTTADIAGQKPSVRALLHLTSGDYELTDSDIVANSVKVRGGTSESNEFSVGAAVIGGLDMSLINADRRYDGADWSGGRIAMVLLVGDTVVNMGDYYIADHHETGNIITVEALDALEVLDKYQIYEDAITWPADAATVAATIAARHGMTVSGISAGYTLQNPGNDLMTERECMAYIAQMYCKYIRVRGSVLSFEWYDQGAGGSNIYRAGTTFAHDLRTDDMTITGVSVTSADGKTTETRGTSEHALSISGNPFIAADNAAQVADTIAAASVGIRYRPGSVTILSSPAVEPGDVILCNTGQEQNVMTLATTVTYTVGKIRETITAEAEPYAGDLRIKRSQYIQQQAQQTIDDNLSNPESNLSQAISGSGSGDAPLHGYLEGSVIYTAAAYGYLIQDGAATWLNGEAVMLAIDPQMITAPRYSRLQSCADAYNSMPEHEGSTSPLTPPYMPFDVRLNGRMIVGYTTYYELDIRARASKYIDTTPAGREIQLGSIEATSNGVPWYNATQAAFVGYIVPDKTLILSIHSITNTGYDGRVWQIFER